VETVERPRDSSTAARVALLGALLLVLSVTVVAGVAVRDVSIVVILATPFVLAPNWLLRWHVIVGWILVVVLFIPIKRYDLSANLPFDLEPYRLVVAAALVVWITALLIDPGVRIRRSGFEQPMALIVIATICSELVNGARVADLSSYVVKAVSFFLSFVLFFYFVVGVVRTRARVDSLVKLLVVGGATLGGFAVLERRTGFNVFDHLHSVVPVLRFLGNDESVRGGDIRAEASAQHPIALGVALVMLLPLAVYLTQREPRHAKRWWAAAALLFGGTLCTGSRTGFLGLVVVLLVFLVLRPAATRKLWPLAVPLALAVHFAVPGAIGEFRSGFFPRGGIIAEQSHVVRGNAQIALLSNNRLADIGPSMTEFREHNPLFGEGYGTRITGYGEEFINAAILDDQWLKTLLETGIAGVIGWLWLLARSTWGLCKLARRDLSEGGWLATALAASIASFAVAMATYDSLSFVQITFLIFVVLALSAVTLRLTGESAAP